MADLLTENVLPVLGLCPPGALLLPWLAQARARDGRALGLPTNAGAATFAVRRRLARREGSAPVAAVLLEDELKPGRSEQATLVMLDWLHELGLHSGVALQRAEPRLIFGLDVPVRRRFLLAVSSDDTLPQQPLVEMALRCRLLSEELGWVSLRALFETLNEHLGRRPQERWRAPERTAQELMGRLRRQGIGPLRAVRPPSPWVLAQVAERGRSRDYEPLRPGTSEFPFRFCPSEEAQNNAMVLEAQRLRRKENEKKAAAMPFSLPSIDK